VVRIDNNIFSQEEKLLMELPRGTVLGPVVFLIYKNGLLNLNFDG